MTLLRNVNIKTQDSPSVDAFARLRVSVPTTIFDSKQTIDNAPLFWDDQEVSGATTTSTHSKPYARSRLGVALNTAGKRVRQTFQRFNYQPGKSQLIILTGVMGTGASGITGEIGMFDDNNGLFFRNDDAVMSVVVRSGVTGSPVDTVVVQSSWNKDKMDGTGVSGITLDFSKTQIFFMDFEWLGVGRVRFGFFVAGKPYYCHEALHANVLDSVYMSTPNLPLRYSIENDGTGVASTLDHICSSVAVEGGVQDIGIVKYVSTASVHVDANTIGTLYAAVGLRLKTTALSAVVKIVTATLLSKTADAYEWVLVLNPTIAGTFTYVDIADSPLQRALGTTANTVTGGTFIGGGFASAAAGVIQPIISERYLGSTIAGVSDRIVLCVRPMATNADIEGGLSWKELV